MSYFNKVAGTWQKSKPYTQVAGTWKYVDYVYNKVGGRWYTSFVKGGLVDKSWDDRDQTGVFGSNANSTVNLIAIQSDGKILACGAFTVWSGTTVGRLVRLNSDDSLDTAFLLDTGTGANNNIESLAIQPSDGKILVGGPFTTWDGTTVNRIVRLNSDGSRDTSFTTNTGTAANTGTITALAIQSDGKILVGGSFTSWNGTTVGRIVRLNSDGTRDTAFTTNNGTGANGQVRTITVQSDGKILLGGQITSWNGTGIGAIARLESTGTRETAFTTNTGSGANSNVFSIKVQSDGKIVVGGQFTAWNGTTAGRIARLNSNGSLDTSFVTNTGTGGTGTVRSVAIQSDGKIIAGGDSQFWNGASVGFIARLNSNGTADTTFTTNNGTGANGSIVSIAVQSDDKILIGGGFSAWNNTRISRIFRLNSDGTGAETLSSFANNTVNSMAVQSDGKILLGGAFTAWNGTIVNRIARLNFNGTLDTSFLTNTGTGGTGNVNAFAVQSDGKIVVGGDFSVWNGATASFIVRLNSDGTKDTTFSTNIGTGSNSVILSLAIQSDGKILVGGALTSWNGTTVGRIVRLNSDGTLDSTFTTNNGTGADAFVRSIAVQSDGKILVGGSFTSWNGTTVGYIVRLNSDGTRETAFTTNTGTGANSFISSMAIQSDGKIIVGGQFVIWNGTTVGYIVRLNSDGSRDTTFTTNTGTGASTGGVNSTAIQSDNKILVCGDYLSWNGTTVNRIVRLNSDGTRDTAFTTNTINGANLAITSVVIQPDGKILAGGSFSTFRDATESRRFLVRIGGEDAS
jgi:uncharacterized delta-60 repeat protein